MKGTGVSEQAGAAGPDASGAGAGAGRKPLSGSVALVTGASSGIGAATALALAREGCSLALVARRTERLEELAEAIGTQGGASLALTADLAAAPEARRTVEQTLDHFGRLDLLVNNAGFGARGAVEDSDPADWDRMVDLNFRAVLRMSHAALPHLLRAAHEAVRPTAQER
ncbi:SDR family NAD(P)-dependent oxidoreductase [Streptomyces sp. NPDC001219]